MSEADLGALIEFGLVRAQEDDLGGPTVSEIEARLGPASPGPLDVMRLAVRRYFDGLASARADFVHDQQIAAVVRLVQEDRYGPVVQIGATFPHLIVANLERILSDVPDHPDAQVLESLVESMRLRPALGWVVQDAVEQELVKLTR